MVGGRELGCGGRDTVAPTVEVSKMSVSLGGGLPTVPPVGSLPNRLHLTSWKHNITQREAEALEQAGQSERNEETEGQER